MAPTIHISPDDVERIAQHAARVHPEEGCGILIGTVVEDVITVDRIVEAANIASGDRTRSYQVDWQALLRTTKTARADENDVVGFYHSHPTGQTAPSASDRQDAWVGRAYLIVTLDAGCLEEVACWWLPAVGAPFEKQQVRSA